MDNNFGDLNPRTIVYRAKPTSTSTTIKNIISTTKTLSPAETAALIAKKNQSDRKKAQNICRTVVLGLCAFFFIVLIAYLQQNVKNNFNILSTFGFTTSYEEDEQGNQPNVVHSTHLIADVEELKNLPFHSKMFHRDLNIQDDEDHKDEFVYGRPVPGMHSKPLPHRETINQVEILW